jgi:hypothetical protein
MYVSAPLHGGVASVQHACPLTDCTGDYYFLHQAAAAILLFYEEIERLTLQSPQCWMIEIMAKLEGM